LKGKFKRKNFRASLERKAFVLIRSWANDVFEDWIRVLLVFWLLFGINP
jgi:hypothetical protein